MIPPPPLNLSDEGADFPHTVEFVREGAALYVHDQDETGRFVTLLWPAARAQDIAAALLRAVGE